MIGSVSELVEFAARIDISWIVEIKLPPPAASDANQTIEMDVAVGSRTGYREEDEDRRREGGHPTCRSRPHLDQRYRLLASSAALRILSLIASLAPFRYPVPYWTIHAATAQPKMKSQVKTSWYRPHHLHSRALGVKSPIR